jgi:FdhD protein
MVTRPGTTTPALADAPLRKPTSTAQVVAVEQGRARRRSDQLVSEEPMEIRLHGPGEEPAPVVVTMRTPGNDFELAVGFCVTEGLLHTPDDLASAAYCLGGDGEQLYNVVTVRRRTPAVAEIRGRTFVATASCGLCGKATLDDIEQRVPPIADGPVVPASVLVTLPEQLRAHQRVFGVTGGLHAAARFGADASLRAVREDVGRHNALDKLIGNAFLDRLLPLSDQIVLVSGRVSFELVQKAAIAGVPILCAVSAPSSLAVNAAERFGLTIVGFLRGDRFNVYSRSERVDNAA